MEVARQPSHATRASVLAVALGFIACGGRSASSEAPPHLPATGGVGALAGRSGGGSPSSGSGGGAGAGGTGGTGTLGPAFSSTGPLTYVPSTHREPNDDETYCGTTDLFSTLEGQSIHQVYDFAGSASNPGPNWSFAAGLPGYGLAEFSGLAEADFAVEALASGIGIDATGSRLVLPRFLPFAAQPACDLGPLYLERRQNYVGLHFNAVALLPSCAEGEPVDGELELCLGDTCGTLRGSLDGSSIDAAFAVHGASGAYADGSTEGVGVRVVFDPTSDTTALVEEAWVRDLVTRDVYCAGAESSADAEPEKSVFGDLRYRRNVHLRGLRRVGSCDEATASGTVTVRACVTR